jgi:hypothetical protein
VGRIQVLCGVSFMETIKDVAKVFGFSDEAMSRDLNQISSGLGNI